MFKDSATHCYRCVFQRVETVTQDDGTDFPEQYGCSANRLEQYKKNGVELIEACNEVQNYYAIPGKFCSMYRNKNWAANNSSLNISEMVELAEEEIAGRLVDVIVFVGKDDSDEDVDKILSELVRQTIKPSKVHLLVQREDFAPGYYLKMLNYYSFGLGSVPVLTHVVDQEMSKEDVVNLVASKSTCYYYAVVTPSFPLPTNFIERLFNRTYRELKGVRLIEGPVQVVQSKVHKLLYEKEDTETVVDKIKELVLESGLDDLVIKYEDLFLDVEGDK